MKPNDSKYDAFNLVKEMFESVDLMRNFDTSACLFAIPALQTHPRIMLTGEGSSRIFPAKRAIYESKKCFASIVETDAALQVLDYNCHDYTVFAASYSGKTSETITLFQTLKGMDTDYLESTYLLHGIEEVLVAGDDVVILIEPYPQVEQKIADLIHKRLGVEIVAIATRDTMFPAIRIPQNERFAEYLQLAAGWKILVETGLAYGIHLDTTSRCKVGNAV